LVRLHNARSGPADYNLAFAPYLMAKAPPAPTSSPQPANYEQAMAELEALVAAMEGGQLPLDGLLQSYRRGADLLNYCRERLEAVESQVKLLEDGQLKPWKNE
jgi:exodeoxyribonuclease VII small subunit